MKDIWKVAHWEFTRYITNKQFIIGLLITPLLMVAFGALPILLERWNKPQEVTYYIVDETGIMPLLTAGSPANLKLVQPQSKDRVEEEVREAEAAGYLVVDSEFLRTGQAALYGSGHTTEGRAYIQAVLSQFLQQGRMQESGLDWEQLNYVSAPAQVEVHTMADVEIPGRQEMVVSGVFVVLIYIIVFSSGTMLMQSAVQEKRDRMIEVVLSSISPQTLMQGKILGHFLLGVFQMAFWLVLAIPAAIFLLDFPVWEALGGVNLGLLALFGLCSYLLNAAMFVGLGATMDDIQNAGNAQGLVMMLPMLSFFFIAPVVSNPNGSVAVLASFFPFTSPVIMIIRSAMTQVPVWQVVLSVIVLLLAVLAISLAAAKVFRVGMLMYGKTASLAEIGKWLRYREE